jgi:hypothetical protein
MRRRFHQQPPRHAAASVTHRISSAIGRIETPPQKSQAQSPSSFSETNPTQTILINISQQFKSHSLFLCQSIPLPKITTSPPPPIITPPTFFRLLFAAIPPAPQTTSALTSLRRPYRQPSTICLTGFGSVYSVYSVVNFQPKTKQPISQAPKLSPFLCQHIPLPKTKTPHPPPITTESSIFRVPISASH